MEVKTTITVDLARPSAPAIVYAKQLDRLSRYITAKLYANGGAFTPPAGVSFEVRGLKPDGTVVVYSKTEKDAAAVTQSGSTLTIYIAQQALAVPGTVRMELAIKSGTAAAGLETLTTFSWLLQVEESAASGTPSTNYINPAIASVASAAINAAGHLILTMTTGATIDAGLAKGADGAAGAKGDPGADGTTPTIGSNGNWFLGSTDTGKPSRGEKGADGAPGKGLEILGTYASLDALSAAVTAPTQGDIYQVGAAAPYTFYMWDGTTPPGAWTSLGELQGPEGERGENGQRGSFWFAGTAISGPFQGDIPFPNSGIELALAGDMYLNTVSSLVYQCTLGGDAETALWRVVGTIRGERGPKGNTGAQGPAGSDAAVTSENVTAALAENPLPVASGGTGAATADEARTNLGALSNADGAVTRSKLAQDALYSPIEYFDGAHVLSAVDIGKTLASSGADENIVTLTTDVSAVLPIGTEVAVFWMAGTSVKLQFTGTMRIVMPGKDVLVNGSLKLSKMFTLVALKKITTDETNGDLWTVQGDVEVVT